MQAPGLPISLPKECRNLPHLVGACCSTQTWANSWLASAEPAFVSKAAAEQQAAQECSSAARADRSWLCQLHWWVA